MKVFSGVSATPSRGLLPHERTTMNQLLTKAFLLSSLQVSWLPFIRLNMWWELYCILIISLLYHSHIHLKNTIKAGGSTVRAQNVDWVMDGWRGWYPLDCYDYWSTYGANKITFTWERHSSIRKKILTLARESTGNRCNKPSANSAWWTSKWTKLVDQPKTLRPRA